MDLSGGWWLTRQEFGDIVSFPVDNDPAGVFGIVAGDIRAGEFPTSHFAVSLYASLSGSECVWCRYRW